MEDVGINPKVNNLVKGYESTNAEIVWILDSNVSMHPKSLLRAVKYFENESIGLVHHVPCAVELKSIGAYLDGTFLSCTHARMYSIINEAHVASCIVGKSNLFRKRDLDSFGGIKIFGIYMSEDNIIGQKIMNLGLRHQIAPDLAYQSIGNVSLSDFLLRRARWIRVRKFTVTLATIYEPFTECLVAGLLASFSFNYYFGTPILLFQLLNLILWFTSDMLVASVVYKSTPFGSYSEMAGFVLAWLCRELIALPVYLWSMSGQHIQDRKSVV